MVFASTNDAKLNELTAILNIYHNLHINANINQHKPFNIVSQSAYNIPTIDEPYNSFLENALHKARHCSYHTSMPALSDDSGICVIELNHAPGVKSARYAANNDTNTTSVNNNKKLIAAIKDYPHNLAYFYCCLALVRFPDDPTPIIATGKIYGTIITTPLGNNGHGYDPIFYIPSLGKTMAELDTAIKNQISHRAIAVKELYTKILRQY